MKLTSHFNFDGFIKSYPNSAQQKLLQLRQLIIDAAQETPTIKELEETLKWNEPSYLTKGSSTIRLDWKQKSPQDVALYFNCKTTLIETFKEIYPKEFSFKGNREITLALKKSYLKKH